MSFVLWRSIWQWPPEARNRVHVFLNTFVNGAFFLRNGLFGEKYLSQQAHTGFRNFHLISLECVYQAGFQIVGAQKLFAGDKVLKLVEIVAGHEEQLQAHGRRLADAGDCGFLL